MTTFSGFLTTRDGGLVRQKAICAVLLALMFLPFVNKAIHIDDVAFLRLGGFFGWNPLRAFPQDYLYQGGIEANFSPYDSTHPLLVPYLLKMLQALFGTEEIWLHLVFLVFPALALWSLAKLADALGGGGAATPLLILFGTVPALVVNGQNLMTDVPTLAFLLAGTAAIARCVQEGRAEFPAWGSFWLGCAVFTSYQALAFIPVLSWFAITGSREARQRRGLLVALLLPVALMFSWLLLVYVNHDLFPLLKSQARTSIEGEILRGLTSGVLWPKIIFILAMTGASLLFVLPVRCCRTGTCHPGRDSLVLLFLTVVFFQLGPGEAGGGQRVMLSFLSALGGFGLGLAFLEIKTWLSRRETRALAVLCGGWIGMTLLVNVFALPFGSARYLLPLFPLLFAVLLRGRDEAPWRFPRLAAVLLLGSLLWGGAHAWADYYQAGTYRTMAAELAGFRRSLGPDASIWYIGEWGMRHYFDRAGIRYLPAASTEPKAGDYVVIPEMPRFWAPSPRLRPRLHFYASREFRSPLPLRLFNRRSGAGFHCHHWGLLPFAFSSEPDEVFIIQEVR